MGRGDALRVAGDDHRQHIVHRRLSRLAHALRSAIRHDETIGELPHVVNVVTDAELNADLGLQTNHGTSEKLDLLRAKSAVGSPEIWTVTPRERLPRRHAAHLWPADLSAQLRPSSL